MLPNFICIGPGRAGTSWLYEILLEHPEVCMAKNIKETNFFNEHHEKGISWYKNFFIDCVGSKAVGEISNKYFYDMAVANRLKNAIPNCKILICLRNPYDRIQSVYHFKRREGSVNVSFEEALDSMPELINQNKYYSLSKPYCELFGSENVFFLFFEDISDNPQRLCVSLFHFLEVDEKFIPASLNKKVNPTIRPKYFFSPFVTKGAAILLRRWGLHSTLTWAKRSEFVKTLFFKKYNYNQEGTASRDILSKLDSILLPEMEKLEKQTGRSVEHWKNSGD